MIKPIIDLNISRLSLIAFVLFLAKGTLSEDTIRLFLRQLGKYYDLYYILMLLISYSIMYLCNIDITLTSNDKQDCGQ